MVGVDSLDDELGFGGQHDRGISFRALSDDRIEHVLYLSGHLVVRSFMKFRGLPHTAFAY